MNKTGYAVVACLAMAVLGVFLLMTGPYDPFASGGLQAQIARGRALYALRCASCHGKSLEGQPNWQTPLPSGRMPAPPHDATGHSWHHTDEMLFGITKLGLKPYVGESYESDMPAFDSILVDEQINAIWAYIKSTWPERERAYQERITRQSKGASQDTVR